MYKHWIRGEFQESASGKSFPVINPATEEVVDHAPRGDANDIERAVEAADHAFRAWRFTPGAGTGGNDARIRAPASRQTAGNRHASDAGRRQTSDRKPG